jgi:hypothetical protein
MRMTRDRTFNSEDLAVLRHTFAPDRTLRGRRTAASMIFYLMIIVTPGGAFMPLTRSESALMVGLIMDNCGRHNTAYIIQEMTRLGIRQFGSRRMRVTPASH